MSNVLDKQRLATKKSQWYMCNMETQTENNIIGKAISNILGMK